MSQEYFVKILKHNNFGHLYALLQDPRKMASRKKKPSRTKVSVLLAPSCGVRPETKSEKNRAANPGFLDNAVKQMANRTNAGTKQLISSPMDDKGPCGFPQSKRIRTSARLGMISEGNPSNQRTKHGN